ncbi:MAG: 3-deoxy-manno-octulosonate cytidylyltransferase [candidate division Zixibacteria bacterium]|nr:3-deoxy-manno-octulosonate cytidylyltransferase [candidate division Zixibacteria bacterium]
MSKSKIIGIIPARLGSKRLAGKPLIMVLGKPLIQNVYESAAKSKRLDRLMVATDSSKVSDLVFAFGGEAYVSLRDHLTGTDRVAEVARNLNYDLVINIQCDLPNFSPTLIDLLASSMLKEKGVLMGTLATRINDPAKLKNPNVVKVVLDKSGFALYFSRHPIPYVRGWGLETGDWKLETGLKRLPFYEHIGIYGFRKDFLMKFSSLKQTPLEKSERLEQIRALENGYKIKVYLTQYRPVTLDVPADLEKIRTRKGGVGR